ncbi:Slp family lipoprotein [Desulfurivibrio alkaliphilus]|uniref:Outer membrane lipoprotein Slp n=1 Tax=Desulfurivibrio alkaliphilus (strain DSM 19089 / UNIQEM U267 / AHT2) TaxID=589865 RepID=D6Z5U8_DESAT|nr:Slp family lipoprotein [Desulfurivibrio alkaliphilus]ADH84830.1 outer membrane lipoprotein Slp [Desulfurivibrio alkaliphilus AHT 2]
MRQLALMLLLPILLAGCATGPRYDTGPVALDLMPAMVSANPEPYRGTEVLWGGLIVATHNLPDYTEIEVLSYPLDRAQRPLADRTPQGRFLLRQAGYLEELDFASGRRVTVKGVLAAPKQGRVGEAPYTYPVVEASDLHLWPPARREPERTRFQIGIGVIFGR